MNDIYIVSCRRLGRNITINTWLGVKLGPFKELLVGRWLIHKIPRIFGVAVFNSKTTLYLTIHISYYLLVVDFLRLLCLFRHKHFVSFDIFNGNSG